MDAKTTPIVVIVVLAVIALGGYLFMNKNDAMTGKTVPQVEEAMMEKEAVEGDAMMEEKGETMEKGSYEAYAPEKLALAAEGEVVLFFRASWCPSCRALNADIKANTVPAGVTILDVNYDTETALKQKYGVTTQHTLVQVDAEGNMLGKWQGSPTLAALVEKVK